MNWWYVVLAAALAGILYWRLVLPNMKSVGATRAPTSTPTPTTGVTPPTGRAANNKKWLFRGLGVGPLVIAGVCVLYFGVYTQSWKSPSPTEVAGWDKFWLLILWVIAAALIAILAEGAVAKTLQKLLAVVMVSLIVLFPFYQWVTSPSTTTPAMQLPSASLPLKEQPSLLVPAHGRTEVIPLPVGRTIEWKGAVGVEYVYRNDPRCDGGKCRTGLYFTNSGSNPVMVTYGYN